MRQDTQFRFKNNFSPGAILELTSSSTPGRQQPSKKGVKSVTGTCEVKIMAAGILAKFD